LERTLQPDALMELLMSDIQSGASTMERAKADLERVERQLAERYSLVRNVRRELVALDRANELHEDDLVAEWHKLYSNYLEWLREESQFIEEACAKTAPQARRLKPTPGASKPSSTEAALAASSLL